MIGTRDMSIFAFTCVSFWALIITLWSIIPFLWMTTRNPNAEWATVQNEGLLTKGYRIVIALAVNVCLLGLFVLQHTGLASVRFKSYMNGSEWAILQRPIYTLTTAIALQGIMRYWQWIPEISLWQLTVEQGTIRWWIFFTVHFLAWVIMYGGCVTMDFSELIGLKQVYYQSVDFDNPIERKSTDLQILLHHMRHPCLSLCVILWCHPYMTLGRIMLSLVFPAYMIMRFSVDTNDYYYQKRQFRAKLQKLNTY